MTDSEMLGEIIRRLGGIEEGQRKLEERQCSLEEGQRKLERRVDGFQSWFETLGKKVERLEQSVIALLGEVGEMRKLMAHLSEDGVVARRAIADIARDVEALKQASP